MPRTLKTPANKEIGERIKMLREERKLSLGKVAKQIDPYVSLQLNGKSGEGRILAIENSTGNLTPEIAIAYSKVFDVSLDYLFCLTNDRRTENKSIKEGLSLTDLAISKIKNFLSGKNAETEMKILNLLFESGLMFELVHSLDSFVFTSQFYNSCKTLSFDYRQKDDTEVVKLIPRWRLDKSVLALTEKIVDLLEKDKSLMMDNE